MSENVQEVQQYYKEIIKKAEIKRTIERVKKKELCEIYGLNYQFYMNTIGGRNLPSKKMVELLEEYIRTPSEKVREMIFLSRTPEEDYHKALDISDDEVDRFLSILREESIINEAEL